MIKRHKDSIERAHELLHKIHKDKLLPKIHAEVKKALHSLRELLDALDN